MVGTQRRKAEPVSRSQAVVWIMALILPIGAASADESLRDHLAARVQSAYVEPFVAGDVDRWLEVFTDDVIALHDGPPRLDGKDQLRVFAEAVRDNFLIRRFDVVVDEFRVKGDWAVTIGHYAAEFQPRNEQAYAPASGPRQGKFLFVWAREAGEWRIMTDMGNSTDNMPP